MNNKKTFTEKYWHYILGQGLMVEFTILFTIYVNIIIAIQLAMFVSSFIAICFRRAFEWIAYAIEKRAALTTAWKETSNVEEWI